MINKVQTDGNVTAWIPERDTCFMLAINDHFYLDKNHFVME